MTRYLDWIIGGVVGSFAFAICKEILLPLLADWLYPRRPQFRGRWHSDIQAKRPDGREEESSEIVVVRQLGTKIWGWTEIGPEPIISDLGLGNRFKGDIRGTSCIVTFESRNKRVPYAGTFFANIIDSCRAEGFSVAKLGDQGPIVARYTLRKLL